MQGLIAGAPVNDRYSAINGTAPGLSQTETSLTRLSNVVAELDQAVLAVEERVRAKVNCLCGEVPAGGGKDQPRVVSNGALDDLTDRVRRIYDMTLVVHEHINRLDRVVG